MNAANYRRTSLNCPFIYQRADPYILRHTDGVFYFTASVPEYDRIVLRRSDTLAGLQTAQEVTIWRRHDRGLMSVHIWAPEIHFIDGAWYIYFAAGDSEDQWAIRPYVLSCKDSDPLTGRWKELGQLQRADDFCFNDFSLDMTVFKHNRRRYAVWAEKVNTGKKISNLYIAEMSSPVCLKSPQMLLSSPSYAWERIGFWVNEGPSFIAGEHSVFLSYSASETGPSYCLGLLRAQANADLLDPNSWTKSKTPVLQSDTEAGLFGPGHNSFFRDEQGHDLMAYHARPYDEISGDPLYDPNRHCYLMRVDWNKGTPIFSFDNNILNHPQAGDIG